MKIGLLDIDGHNFPNIALMKLSAYHKRQNHNVSWYTGIERFDRVYMSKVFTFSPDEGRIIQADEIIHGGTGYKIYDQNLPEEIEHIAPDYSIYPQFSEAYGFLTRGCINKCPFCIVPQKEGMIRPHADIDEFLSGRKHAILMDNNILACNWGLQQIEKIASSKTKVDFNQGLDCRIIAANKDIAKLLKRVHWIRFIRMAYDSSSITNQVETAISHLNNAGIPSSKLFFYMLVKKDGINDAEARAMRLKRFGCVPFAMSYRDFTTNEPISDEQRQFAWWVNRKEAFNTTTWQQFNIALRKQPHPDEKQLSIKF